jgi:uncharacterized protein
MNVLDFLTNGQASQLGTNGDGAQRLVANLMLQRAELMKSLLDSPRDVDGDCGYPSGYISTNLYKLLYDREPLATRTVEVYPKESWQIFPSVFEDEDVNNITSFEEAWDALGKQLRGEQSFYQEEEASTVWTYLSDADIKCGIGHYAGILLGLDDGAPLNEPADMISANGNGMQKASGDSASRRLLFIRVFGETDMRINSLETDISSPRYGQPTEYDISLIDPTEFTSLGLGASLPTNRAVVHWSRVVHISEYGVLHTPRMQPVLNRLLDTRKLYGGSAEMYWRGAFPGYAIKTQPQLGADVDINKEDVKQQLTDYSNALQRFLVLMGMDITALAPQVSDPASQIDKQIEAICIQLGVPKRIFMGSERGELASSQDDAAFDDRLKQRQLGVITPRIIIPFVDRLIATRVLPRPAKGYRVSWPDLTSKSDEEKAGIATQRTQAISAYVAGQLETTLAPMDFWTRIMGFTEDEAQSIIDNAEEVKQQKEKEQAAKDAEAAKVQAEAQAKMDATAKMAADATGTEQTATAPGSSTSPGKPFGGKGSQSPTSTPPNGSTGQPGGSNTGGDGKSPVTHAADLSGGHWVTIHGTPIYIRGSSIVAGPGARKALPSDQETLQARARKKSSDAGKASRKAENSGSLQDHVKALGLHADAAHLYDHLAAHQGGKEASVSTFAATSSRKKAAEHASVLGLRPGEPSIPQLTSTNPTSGSNDHGTGHLLGHEQIRALAQPGEGHKEFKQRLADHLATIARPGGLIKEHGMTTSEEMHHVKVDGVEVHFPQTDSGRRAAASTLAEAVGAGINKRALPAALWNAQRRIIFTDQLNRHDKQMQERHNNPDHVSAATAGDGQIVVYRGALGATTLAHEAGHNLATKVWGGLVPQLHHEHGDYAKAQLKEDPVSRYAARSNNREAEDFAEATRMYATDPTFLKVNFPAKHAAMDKLLKEYKG